MADSAPAGTPLQLGLITETERPLSSRHDTHVLVARKTGGLPPVFAPSVPRPRLSSPPVLPRVNRGAQPYARLGCALRCPRTSEGEVHGRSCPRFSARWQASVSPGFPRFPGHARGRGSSISSARPVVLTAERPVPLDELPCVQLPRVPTPTAVGVEAVPRTEVGKRRQALPLGDRDVFLRSDGDGMGACDVVVLAARERRCSSASPQEMNLQAGWAVLWSEDDLRVPPREFFEGSPGMPVPRERACRTLQRPDVVPLPPANDGGGHGDGESAVG